MKQFNLEEYIRLKAEGREPKLCTRYGHNVRMLCIDRKNVAQGTPFPIVALIELENTEHATYYTASGNYYEKGGSRFDLFFADQY